MSFRHEGLTCCVCHAYLFEEDDVVYCPECGAPHHRDCYNSVGHCGLEATHGTPEQYDIIKEKEKLAQKEKDAEEKTAEQSFNSGRPSVRFISNDSAHCNNCDNDYPSIMNRCPRCGAPNENGSRTEGFGGFNIQQFDFLGGVPSDMDLGEGVTAEEAKQFVISNTHRYIPKFASMKNGGKTSWNWFAFIFPPAWFLSRKMNKMGILSAALMIAFSLLTYPMITALAYLDTSSARNYMEIAQLITENISVIGPAALALATIGSVLNILLRIVLAIFADNIYRNHTLSTISLIKKTPDCDIKESFRKKGGTSFWGLLLGFFAVEYLPTIIISFL